MSIRREQCGMLPERPKYLRQIRPAGEELTQCDYSKTLHYTYNPFILLPDRRLRK
jgi:hypothetical protein